MSNRMGQSRPGGTIFSVCSLTAHRSWSNREQQDLLRMTTMGVLYLLAEGSLTNSFNAVNFGSIMGHYSTQMSLSENKERAIGSGTLFPEG